MIEKGVYNCNMKKTTILSWNVNGVRAASKKGLLEWLHLESPDILCIQETKAHPDQLDDVITIQQRVWGGNQRPWRDRLARRLVEAPQTLCLCVAYVDGTPASTAQISFYAQRPFASLVRAATLPAYRGRGLFSALVAALVQEARQRNVQFLDTEATAMSRPILQKLGWQQLTLATPCTWHFKPAPAPGGGY